MHISHILNEVLNQCRHKKKKKSSESPHFEKPSLCFSWSSPTLFVAFLTEYHESYQCCIMDHPIFSGLKQQPWVIFHNSVDSLYWKVEGGWQLVLSPHVFSMWFLILQKASLQMSSWQCLSRANNRNNKASKYIPLKVTASHLLYNMKWFKCQGQARFKRDINQCLLLMEEDRLQMGQMEYCRHLWI